jgi:hypothetical protein
LVLQSGDLVHLNVKKVGRIPDGGVWWTRGRGSVGHKKSQRRGRIGYYYAHAAIDNDSRPAYNEALDDDGSCYRSRVFNDVLADGAMTHKYTRPYRPQERPQRSRGSCTATTTIDRTALRGFPPIHRPRVVTNLSGFNN